MQTVIPPAIHVSTMTKVTLLQLLFDQKIFIQATCQKSQFHAIPLFVCCNACVLI